MNTEDKIYKNQTIMTIVILMLMNAFVVINIDYINGQIQQFKKEFNIHV